jgi:hypothetical protein
MQNPAAPVRLTPHTATGAAACQGEGGTCTGAVPPFGLLLQEHSPAGDGVQKTFRCQDPQSPGDRGLTYVVVLSQGSRGRQRLIPLPLASRYAPPQVGSDNLRRPGRSPRHAVIFTPHDHLRDLPALSHLSQLHQVPTIGTAMNDEPRPPEAPASWAEAHVPPRDVPPGSTPLREVAHAVDRALTLTSADTSRGELAYLRVINARARMVRAAMRRIISDREMDDRDLMAVVALLRAQVEETQ